MANGTSWQDLPLTKCTLGSALLATLIGVATAQSLPAPSRTVYKCEEAGKVVYSDSPCLGAKRVDVEPTRGLDQMSGKKQVGKDVRREQRQEVMAQALKPLTNETPDQYKQRVRRSKLSPSAQAKCQRLDRQVDRAEAQEKAATPANLAAVQDRLLRLRLEQRDLKC